uniref:Uncharacterized protein n=2 Tax=environmental samples TaxID=651140 RepID=A0A075FSZ5_9ARCH|nr:hypothetical protein [uncultured marine thaumarchaeote AD1000_46_C12]AIE94506.1 hypothetical protein [uncultured marine thaumarchaeote AD1000_46_F05]
MLSHVARSNTVVLSVESKSSNNTPAPPPITIIEIIPIIAAFLPNEDDFFFFGIPRSICVTNFSSSEGSLSMESSISPATLCKYFFSYSSKLDGLLGELVSIEFCNSGVTVSFISLEFDFEV